MAQPMQVAPTFTVRLQKGISSSLQPGSSPSQILELASESEGEYQLTMHARNAPNEDGVESAMYETSLGKLTSQEVNDLGIWSAVSALESMPQGAHDKDAYGFDTQILYTKPPSFEWCNGPKDESSPVKKQAEEPSDEDKAKFEHIIKVIEQLQTRANKGVGSGKLDAKGTEPDMALED